MSNSNWVMPDWMKPYESFFHDKGALGVEALMNTYGSKCADKLIAANTGKACAIEPGDLHALIVNAQVGMLVGLHAAGMLRVPGGQ